MRTDFSDWPFVHVFHDGVLTLVCPYPDMVALVPKALFGTMNYGPQRWLWLWA